LYDTRWDILPLITEQLIDFMRCNLGNISEITEARKVAAITETCHGPGDIAPITHAANVHLNPAVSSLPSTV
jgi:mannonate dehydratase